MRGRRAIAASCACLFAAVMAAPALASPGSDLASVYKDWSSGDSVTSCRFSRAQLEHARDGIVAVPDYALYAPSFIDDMNREIARVDHHVCRGVAKRPARKKLAKSRFRRLALGTVRPRGRESVAIRNAGRAAVTLAGGSLRNRAGRRLRLHGILGPRSTIRVFSRGLWKDSGDMVKLADPHGLVVRQTGFGSYERFLSF
jgi:hypothetical protein